MTEDAHSRPTGAAPEPLYDVNVPTPTHAERARTLVTRLDRYSVQPGPRARRTPLRLVCDGGVRRWRPGCSF